MGVITRLPAKTVQQAGFLPAGGVLTIANRDGSGLVYYLSKVSGEIPTYAEVLAGTSVAVGATATLHFFAQAWVWVATATGCDITVTCSGLSADYAVPAPRVWDSEAYASNIDTTGEVVSFGGEFPAQTGMMIAHLGASGALWIGANLASGLADLTSAFQTHILLPGQRVEISCRASDTIHLKASSGTIDIAAQRYSDRGVA